MIPHVTRGDRMGGLMAYLAGPGRANEHRAPHVVAGDDHVLAWWSEVELSPAAALDLAAHLDAPQRVFGTEVAGGHVWHCSLSVRASEGELGDERWRQIAERFVGAMGVDDAGGTKAPVRWVAIHHGQSSAGNDHVHIAVNLVREDGTRVPVHRDFARAQAAARALEVEFGLERLEGQERGRSTRAHDPAEREAAARRAARAAHEEARRTGAEQRAWEDLPTAERRARAAAHAPAFEPRHALEVAVRGCAAAAADEAEFVRRLRRQGLLVRPRFAAGTHDVVAGYSVAERPPPGARLQPLWYGGGHLARDLSLPRLRSGWDDTPEGAAAAAAEWVAAGRNRRAVAPGREAREPDPQLWARVERDLAEQRERLRAVAGSDHAEWARAARATAGAFAAWSRATEAEPGPLAAAAIALARSAHLRTEPPPPSGAVQWGSSAAMLLASAARGGQGTVAQLALLRQLMNMARALHDMHRATEARRAAEIEAAMRSRELAALVASMPAPPQEAAQRTQQPAGRVPQVLPAPLGAERASTGMSR